MQKLATGQSNENHKESTDLTCMDQDQNWIFVVAAELFVNFHNGSFF